MNTDYMSKTPEELIEMIKFYRYDSLTGMKLRKDFEIDFSEKFYSGNKFYLIMVDVNNLHKINRTLGYQAGDDLIRRVATMVKFYCMSKSYRYGGDEFMAIKESKPDMSKITTKDACFAYISSKEFESPAAMIKTLDEKLTACKVKLHKNKINDRRVDVNSK